MQDFRKNHYYLENFLSVFLPIVYAYNGLDDSINHKKALSKVEYGISCTIEAQSHTNQIIFKLSGKETVRLDWETLRGDS